MGQAAFAPQCCSEDGCEEFSLPHLSCDVRTGLHRQLVILSVVDNVEALALARKFRLQTEKSIGSIYLFPHLPRDILTRHHGESIILAVIDDVQAFALAREFRLQTAELCTLGMRFVGDRQNDKLNRCKCKQDSKWLFHKVDPWLLGIERTTDLEIATFIHALEI